MKAERHWVKAVRCGDIPPREGRAVRFGAREIAIFNLGERFLAVDNRCPHKSGPLAEGIVAGNAVVCPLHAWKIDLQSGSVARPATENSCVQAYAVRVVDGVIEIKLPLRSPSETHAPSHCLEGNSTAGWPFAAGPIGEIAP